MHYRLPLFVIVAFSLLLSFSYLNFFATNESAVVYKCPPCGCVLDDVHFDSPGQCEECNMKLYKDDTGLIELAAFSGNVLKNDVNTLYTKFIYPSFIIGILLGILSLVKLNGKSVNPFFGGLLLVIALYGFKNQLFGVSYGLSSDFRFLFVPISFITLMGPLAYFYIKSQTETLDWQRKYFIHFIPAALFFIGYCILLISPDEIKRQYMSTPFEPFFGHAEQLMAVILLLAYLFYAAKNIELTDSDRENFKYKWIKRFQYTLIFLSIVWLALITANFEFFSMGVATVTYNPLWIIFSLIIYWAIIEVMLNPKHFFVQTFHIGSNGYSIEKMEIDKSTLLKTMENEEPYLDPSLNLDKLAIQTEMNPKYLSLLLNSTLNKNFYEFVNEYRIEKVKELLVSPNLKHLTIAAIANEAGFNSKSSFNSIFKKYTNLTPKEFLKQQSSNGSV